MALKCQLTRTCLSAGSIFKNDDLLIYPPISLSCPLLPLVLPLSSTPLSFALLLLLLLLLLLFQFNMSIVSMNIYKINGHLCLISSAFIRGVIIDSLSVERNHVLVRVSVVGGPSERRLPPRALQELLAGWFSFSFLTTKTFVK
ncbi:hypothetical protein INR49_018947 [Caranx melampygus]|nr:hypothetical protein INR49_018947 [Caranx melampygus]